MGAWGYLPFENGAGGAWSGLSGPFIGGLGLYAVACAADSGRRPAAGFDQNNQHGQDGDRPGNRDEEHQADRR